MAKAGFRALTGRIPKTARAKTKALTIIMAHRHQGIRQRVAESQRKEKSAAKRLRRLARRKAKRKQTYPTSEAFCRWC
jgi:hypothetical protein